MEKEIKRVSFKEGKAFHTYACKYPYKKEYIIKEGLPFEIWIKTPRHKPEEEDV